MNELIPISEHNGQKAVSARLLHEFLGSKRNFADWIKDKIKKYGFVENQEFVSFSQIRESGGRTIEYALTIDCAKELSMVEGNAKGKQARRYFIECEKVAKETTKALSPAEMLLQQAQLAVAQEKRINAIETKINEIEAKTTTRPDYFTIVGYGTLHKISINLKQASSLGRKATDICKKRGYIMDKIPDPRFGEVKMYPRSVLDEVFDAPITQMKQQGYPPPKGYT